MFKKEMKIFVLCYQIVEEPAPSGPRQQMQLAASINSEFKAVGAVIIYTRRSVARDWSI